jgi:hypothetical protein
VVGVNDGLPVRHLDAEVVEGVVVEGLPVRDHQHEVQLQIATDEGRVAMRPFLRPDAEQPSVPARAARQVADAAPKIGALGLMWTIGAWAVLHGLLMVPFALSLRHSDALRVSSSRNIQP